MLPRHLSSSMATLRTTSISSETFCTDVGPIPVLIRTEVERARRKRSELAEADKSEKTKGCPLKGWDQETVDATSSYFIPTYSSLRYNRHGLFFSVWASFHIELAALSRSYASVWFECMKMYFGWVQRASFSLQPLHLSPHFWIMKCVRWPGVPAVTLSASRLGSLRMLEAI
jgi:hypothetical protein